MIRKTFSLLFLALLGLTGCTAGIREPFAYRQISAPEALEMMRTEQNYIIVDVRTEAEYAAGHIPGAVMLPNETIGTSDIPQLPDKSQLILVYCRSGSRSKQAAGKLAQLGYTQVVEFGGINTWLGEIVTEE